MSKLRQTALLSLIVLVAACQSQGQDRSREVSSAANTPAQTSKQTTTEPAGGRSPNPPDVSKGRAFAKVASATHAALHAANTATPGLRVGNLSKLESSTHRTFGGSRDRVTQRGQVEMTLRSEDGKPHTIALKRLTFLDGRGCKPAHVDPPEVVEITGVTLERHSAKHYRLIEQQKLDGLRVEIPATDDIISLVIDHAPVQTHLSCKWHDYHIGVEVDGVAGVFGEAVRVIERPPHPYRER